MKEVYEYRISTGELSVSYPLSNDYAEKHIEKGNRNPDYYLWVVQVYPHEK